MHVKSRVCTSTKNTYTFSVEKKKKEYNKLNATFVHETFAITELCLYMHQQSQLTIYQKKTVSTQFIYQKNSLNSLFCMH